MAEEDKDGEFLRLFTRWARRVRQRLSTRGLLAGTSIGLFAGALAATAAWWWRYGELRPFAALLGVAGAIVGVAWMQRRRWSDETVALYLDKKLGSDETITTAIELASSEDSAARALVIDRAVEVLGSKPPKGMWPRMWRVWHAVAPLSAGAIVWLSLTQLPPGPPAPPPPPGSDIVTLEDVEGLDEVIELSDLDARDPKERERLRELSERAKKLREKLRDGMERREAQAEIAKLRDDIAAERQRFGSGEERAGLEAAMNKMSKNPDLGEAQKALGDRDLTRFDQEMEKLANKLEAADREQAKKALEEAIEAAKKAGAKNVAKSLEEQKKLLEERAKRAEALKELAESFGEGLSPEAKKALEDFKDSGSGEDAQKLAEELGKALEGLSEEDKKKLAEKLKQEASKMNPDGAGAMPMTKEQLEEMQKKLSSPEGQKELAEQLKEWANQPPQSQDAQKQQELDDAGRGCELTQKQLGMPVPTPGKGGKDGKGNGKGNGKDQANADDKGKGKGGPGPGGGRGDHGGSTQKVAGDGVRSRANARINPGSPNPGVSLGRAPGKEGETANKVGTGVLGEVGPGEVGDVDKSEVPEEYREQVGRYFEP